MTTTLNTVNVPGGQDLQDDDGKTLFSIQLNDEEHTYSVDGFIEMNGCELFEWESLEAVQFFALAFYAEHLHKN